MSYKVYRICGGKQPYIDLVAAFEFENGAVAFCESERCQQANAIREKGLGLAFVCVHDREGVQFHKYFQWDGEA